VEEKRKIIQQLLIKGKISVKIDFFCISYFDNIMMKLIIHFWIFKKWSSKKYKCLYF